MATKPPTSYKVNLRISFLKSSRVARPCATDRRPKLHWAVSKSVDEKSKTWRRWQQCPSLAAKRKVQAPVPPFKVETSFKVAWYVTNAWKFTCSRLHWNFLDLCLDIDSQLGSWTWLIYSHVPCWTWSILGRPQKNNLLLTCWCDTDQEWGNGS